MSGERGGEKGGAEAINEVHQLIKKIANTNQSVRNQRISDEQCGMGAARNAILPVKRTALCRSGSRLQWTIRFFPHGRKKTDCARSLPRPEIGSANKMRPVARAGERRADRATSESKYIYISHSGTRHIPS